MANMTPHTCKSIGCFALAARNSDFCMECEEEHRSSAAANDSVQLQAVVAQLPLEGDRDPHGKNQHEPGAKVDAGKVRMHLITGGMARAITEVAKVGTFGAAKYTDNGWIAVPDGFRRYEDAQQRHAAKRHMGETHDPDSSLLHLAHEAWNAMAKLDLYLREQETGNF